MHERGDLKVSGSHGVWSGWEGSNPHLRLKSRYKLPVMLAWQRKLRGSARNSEIDVRNRRVELLRLHSGAVALPAIRANRSCVPVVQLLSFRRQSFWRDVLTMIPYSLGLQVLQPCAAHMGRRG